MCGIIGQSVSSNIDFSDKIFNKAFADLKHRGPDYQKIITHNKNKNHIKIGFCRLSIQDLTENANRIFQDSENSLLFNGEIYNYKELKVKYFTNINFDTQTDTELLFKFIKKFGFTKINELNGIFAIAWINLKKNVITLCRDSTGVKTLYYMNENNNFYFCSEAWFLYEISKNKKINIDGLNFYLRYGFNHIEKCIYNNIFKVKPGEIVEFDINANYLKKIKYIDLEKEYENSNNEIDSDLENSVKLNLISDAKVGLYLSGGLDSSIIAVLAKKNNNLIEGYTNTYEDKKFYSINEDFNYANELCKNYHIKLFSNHISANNHEDVEFLKSLDFFDEPLSNLNIFNSFKQAKYANQNGIKVILTGDGADEVFGGYKKYCDTKIYQNFSFFSAISKKIKKYKNYNKNYFPLLFFEKLNEDDIKNLLGQDLFYEILKSNSHFFVKDNKDLNTTLNEFDFTNWMTNDHNFKLDRTLMANSIEGRVPFQEQNIIKKYYKIKMSKKVNFFETKLLLRNNNILNKKFKQRKKQGWHLPERWFVNKIIKPIFFDYLHQNKFINKYYAENLFNKKYYKKLPVYKIITIFMLMHWNNKVKLF